MAKSMARIENGVVVNIEWWNEEKLETNTLININDKLVNLGDIYNDGVFYHEEPEELNEELEEPEEPEELNEELEEPNEEYEETEELNEESIIE